jgi:hypothetical protein
MKLPQIPADKASHVLYGMLIFCVFGLFSPIIGLCAAVVVGAAKEAYDSTGRGNVEFMDFVATACGGLFGFFCTYL